MKQITRRMPIAAATLAAALATPIWANIAPNPSFENNGGYNTGPNHSIVTGNARTGSKSLQLISNGNVSTTVSSRMSASAGEEFVLSSYVKAENLVLSPNAPGLTPIQLVRFRDGSKVVLNAHGRWTEGYRWAPFDPDGNYGYRNTGMDMRFQMTSEGDGFDIGFRTWSQNVSGKTIWDDVSVRRLTFPDRGTKLATYQAENANTITRGFIDNDEKEFTGTGYVDITGNNAELTWNNVQGGGERVISIRYSWEGFVKTFKLFINGQQVGSSGGQQGVPTGRRGLYATSDFVVNLPSGGNTVKLVVGKGGGPLGQPLIDKIDVYAKSGDTTPPPPPSPELPGTPSNLQASDSTFDDKIRITWNAGSDTDSYELYRRVGTSGNGSKLLDLSATTYDDTSASANVNYAYRARGCNSDGCGSYSAWNAGSRAESDGGGNGGNMGGGDTGLSGVMETSVANASLSLDAIDFVKPGNPEVRMSNVTQQISAITAIGAANGFPHNRAPFGHSWQNGTPRLTGNNVKNGLRIYGNNKGLEFTVPAGSAARTLSVWVSGVGKSNEALDATVSAVLSDGSSDSYSATFSQTGTRRIGRLINITYSAASDGQQLTVRLMKNGGNWTSIDGIKLMGADDGQTNNTPPTISSISNQTIVAGDALRVDFIAEDPEGTEITFSKSDNLPGNASVLTNSGSGIGSLDWQSGNNDAGQYSVTITAKDANNSTVSEAFTVTVQPVSGGGNGSISVSESELPTGATVTLTGSYIKYAPTTAISEATNAAGAMPFSPIIRIGDALGPRSAVSSARYTYTNATPANGTRLKGGTRIFDPAPVALQIEVDAGTNARSASIYVGVKDSLARVTATLSDGSSSPQVIEIDRRNSSLKSYQLDFDYQAASSNAKLIVTLENAALTDDSVVGFVQFEAAQQ